VGFGIRTPAAAAAVARVADAAVVGSSIVQCLADSLVEGKATPQTVPQTLALVQDLATGVRTARVGVSA
jgi:tryptophan synthase alpha chain